MPLKLFWALTGHLQTYIYVFEQEIFHNTTAVETLLHDMSITLSSLRIRKGSKVMVKAEFAPATEDMFISGQSSLHHMQANSYISVLQNSMDSAEISTTLSVSRDPNSNAVGGKRSEPNTCRTKYRRNHDKLDICDNPEPQVFKEQHCGANTQQSACRREYLLSGPLQLMAPFQYSSQVHVKQYASCQKEGQKRPRPDRYSR
ncbi:hypothetical protein VB005_11763 [Metarhizium brunneum]